MSPRISRTPSCCTRRISSHSRSTTSFGSPLPLMTRLPSSTPLGCTVPVNHTGVFHVHAGPSRSSAAVVVSSFISEAGFTGVWFCQDKRGCVAPRSCTTATIDSFGTWARCRAASTAAGRVSCCAAGCALHGLHASAAKVMATRRT